MALRFILEGNNTPELHALTGKSYMLQGTKNTGQMARVIGPCFLLENSVEVENVETKVTWSVSLANMRRALAAEEVRLSKLPSA